MLLPPLLGTISCLAFVWATYWLCCTASLKDGLDLLYSSQDLETGTGCASRLMMIWSHVSISYVAMPPKLCPDSWTRATALTVSSWRQPFLLWYASWSWLTWLFSLEQSNKSSVWYPSGSEFWPLPKCRILLRCLLSLWSRFCFVLSGGISWMTAFLYGRVFLQLYFFLCFKIPLNFLLSMSSSSCFKHIYLICKLFRYINKYIFKFWGT